MSTAIKDRAMPAAKKMGKAADQVGQVVGMFISKPITRRQRVMHRFKKFGIQSLAQGATGAIAGLARSRMQAGKTAPQAK
jgi:hypothetical protein